LPASAIHIHQLTKSYNGIRVLNAISLEIAQGEIVAVLGPSGCGKTTLLRVLAGFERLETGTVMLGDRLYSSPQFHLPPEKRDLGIVFQSYALWPHMTVAGNVEYSLKVSGVSAVERQQRVDEALAMVGLSAFARRSPADLSGGQRQRVALARCLVARPQVVLLDEPLANLDVHLRAAMEEEFIRFHQHTGATLVYITHDQQEAMAIADRIVVMDQGEIMQFATPQQLYREPANEMVATFIDDGRLMPISDIEPLGDGHASVQLAGQRYRLRCHVHQSAQPAGIACLHADDLRPAKPDDIAFGTTIKRIIYRGSYSQIDVEPNRVPGARLTLHLPNADGLRPGDTLPLTLNNGWIIPSFTSA
jgi:iron(III) transport system ATP-binding protein